MNFDVVLMKVRHLPLSKAKLVAPYTQKGSWSEFIRIPGPRGLDPLLGQTDLEPS